MIDDTDQVLWSDFEEHQKDEAGHVLTYEDL